MAMEQVYHNHCTRAKPSETFAWLLRNIGVMQGANRFVGDWEKAIGAFGGAKVQRQIRGVSVGCPDESRERL